MRDEYSVFTSNAVAADPPAASPKELETMSHWGYIIEQLMHDDEKQRIARKHLRNRRLARMSGRSQPPSSGDAREQPPAKRRVAWSLLSPRQ
jgi:hypothetical protein